MSGLPRWTGIVLIVLCSAALAACRTVPDPEEVPAGEATVPPAAETGPTAADVAQRDRRIRQLESDMNAVGDQLDAALREIAELQEERLALLDEVERLRRERRDLREAAAKAEMPQARLPDEQATSRTPHATGLDATGSFVSVARAGYQADPRAAGRLAAWSPGIAADTGGPVPVLFDIRHRYDSTMPYLTIEDPAGPSPRLLLTVQHVSEESPLLLHTAVLSVDKDDPVDPVEPIILSGNPLRKTDGRLLIESLRKEADASVAERLAVMISSPQLIVKFMGSLGERVHRVRVGERAAMTNVLFAYMDLAGPE